MSKFVSPDAETALRLPLGAVSPLWLMFGAAAITGAAVFWARSWLKPTNLEAALNPQPLPTLEAPTEAVEETVEAVADEVVETVAVAADSTTEAAEAVAEAVPEAVETTTTVVEAAADDLTRLTGIGPKLAASLAERGVTRFAEIAAWTAADVEKFDKDMKLMGRIEREAWIAQARRYAEAAVH
jgi:predicted flap endonuclease-1-like 5' DNA nuclease